MALLGTCNKDFSRFPKNVEDRGKDCLPRVTKESLKGYGRAKPMGQT
jgi:hypothetical protein